MLLLIAPQLLLASEEELEGVLALYPSPLELARAASVAAAAGAARALRGGGGGGGNPGLPSAWDAQQLAAAVALQHGGQSFWGGEVGGEAAERVVAAELAERWLERDHLRLCALKLCGAQGLTLEELGALLREKPTLLREVRL